MQQQSFCFCQTQRVAIVELFFFKYTHTHLCIYYILYIYIYWCCLLRPREGHGNVNPFIAKGPQLDILGRAKMDRRDKFVCRKDPMPNYMRAGQMDLWSLYIRYVNYVPPLTSPAGLLPAAAWSTITHNSMPHCTKTANGYGSLGWCCYLPTSLPSIPTLFCNSCDNTARADNNALP